MLKPMLVGAFALSSLALAAPAPAAHQARPVVVPPPPPAAVVHDARNDQRQLSDDRFDALQATQLLRDFDVAANRRDARAMRNVDAQFNLFLSQEVREARVELAQAQREYRRDGYNRRDGNDTLRAQRTLDQLVGLQRQMVRLTGRVDRWSVSQKRDLYRQAATIAQRELRQDRGERREDHRRGF